jgi:hypothetical protein
MYRRDGQELQAAKIELQSANAELDELTRHLRAFEAQVDDRLGSLLDQLNQLNAEKNALDEQLRHIRESHLFGTDLLTYLDGAPRPARPNNLTDLPPLGISNRNVLHPIDDSISNSSQTHIPDIKILYRQLARRHHPDLARNDTDRILSNEQMKEINQAYDAGDMRTLMKLAGMSIPDGEDLQQPPFPKADLPDITMPESEQIKQKLRAVRQQFIQLSNLPIIKLSLDVKLARHQGRDLLGEMVAELQYKVARKMVERDYLQSQIHASAGQKED